MSKPQKKWSSLTTPELAAATRAFDDPSYHPEAQPAPKRDREALQRLRKKAKLHRLAVAIEPKLMSETDAYATSRGITVSDVVSDALQHWMRRKSA